MSSLFAQLPYLVIQLGIDGIGIVLALSYMQRAKRPATFVLAGSVLMLAATLGTTLITSVLIGGGGVSNAAAFLGMINIVASLVRGAGIGLLFAAAFVERGSAAAPAVAGTLSDRIGNVCTACGARGPAAASFCMHCGAAHS